MGHVGVICPNAPGHLNPMVALADATRGHRVTFFLLGDPPASVAAAGFEIISLGGSVFPPDQYRAGLQRLGSLQGRTALKHTFSIGARSAEAILEVGPTAARAAGVTALLVNQALSHGGTVADQLGLPFATVCNALLLHLDPAAPPFFTHWQPRDTGWARIRNRIAWAGLNRLYAPILTRIQDRRRRLGLPVPARIAAAWSDRLQISQQPEAFEFPRRELPKHVRFVGPLRLPGGYQPVPFPWERLGGRPLIYASLGTLQNRVAGTFRVIAEACDGLDAQLVISTGHGVAPGGARRTPGPPGRGPLRPPVGPAPPVRRRGDPCRPEHRPRSAGHRDSDGSSPDHERSAGDRRPRRLGRGRRGHPPHALDPPGAARRGGPRAVGPVPPRCSRAGPGLHPGGRRGSACRGDDRADFGARGVISEFGGLVVRHGRTIRGWSSTGAVTATGLRTALRRGNLGAELPHWAGSGPSRPEFI